MQYVSTRGQSPAVSFSQAVAQGLAPDGGLYIPEKLPDLSTLFAECEGLSYMELCYRFFKVFATDMDPDVLQACVEQSYQPFNHPEVAPLVSLDDETYVLELFHGPTLAFKDFALQLLGNLYEEQITRTGETINVLGATSGDTGAAAIHGLLGKKGVRIFILYPDGRVSPLQERQMTCTGADNVYAMAIEGSFDDAQAALKDTFGDAGFKSQVRLSAVNSINLARVLAQCVYYVYAYYRLPESKRHAEFVVPTGNFGNVLAGWMAQKMGLPIKSFCVATNQNDILYRLFTSGLYEVQSVEPSHAPSMDIQVASNFERFLYFSQKGDAARVSEIMKRFKETGRYSFPNFAPDSFTASRVDDAQILEIITRVYKRYGYICDPHTACGFAADLDSSAPRKPRVILSTAHPAKFPAVIEQAIGKEATHPTLEALKQATPRKYHVGADKASIQSFILEHGIRDAAL
ncbi:MAG: threonine synthase [Opitutales bacterium]|nr:threonine synthase [Opitutales bacterium]